MANIFSNQSKDATKIWPIIAVRLKSGWSPQNATLFRLGFPRSARPLFSHLFPHVSPLPNFHLLVLKVENNKGFRHNKPLSRNAPSAPYLSFLLV